MGLKSFELSRGIFSSMQQGRGVRGWHAEQRNRSFESKGFTRRRRGEESTILIGRRLTRRRVGSWLLDSPVYGELERCFAEFTLSELRRFFASLRMTGEGLEMTPKGSE